MPCVIATNVLGYLPPDELATVLCTLDAYGRDRDLLVALNDLPARGAALFAPEAADYLDPSRAAGALALVAYTGGTPTVEMLGRSGPFGASIVGSPQLPLRLCSRNATRGQLVDVRQRRRVDSGGHRGTGPRPARRTRRRGRRRPRDLR